MTTATKPVALSARPSKCTACLRSFPTFVLRCQCGSTLIVLRASA